MALSNISSKHANNLLAELNTQELAITNNIKVIKSQHSTVAKLEILYRQMEFLKSEIQRVLDESSMTSLLNNATMKCVKCPNTTYHLYKKNQNQEYLRLVVHLMYGGLDQHILKILKCTIKQNINKKISGQSIIKNY